MSYANKAAVLLFVFVLAFSFIMAPTAPQRAELASSPDLTPEAVEQIDTWYDMLNQPGYTATVAPLLAEWVETGEISEKMVTKRDGSVSAMIVVAPWADRDAIEALVNVEMVMDLNVFTTMWVSIPSADRISMIAEIEGVGLVDSDLYRFERDNDLVRQTFQYETPIEGIDMDVIAGVVGATAGAAVNYDGTGVVVGHLDTGCDFGNPDLQHAFNDGTYDGTGLGMAMTWYHANSTVVNETVWLSDPYNMLTYESGGDIYMDVDGWDPILNNANGPRHLYGDGNSTTPYVSRVGFIWLYAYYWGIDVGQILDYIQEDWKLPDPATVNSNYSVGWVFQQRWDPYAKFFAPLVVYNDTSDVSKVIINWEDTMGWMKLWTGGFNYETYDLTDIFDAYEIIMEFDFDFTDEVADGEVFDMTNNILVHDYDGDGNDDVSFGALAWGYDAAGWFVVNATTGEYDGDVIFNGIRSDHEMLSIYWDDGTHGTSTATHIAGIGNTYYNFDNESTFQMTGIAPGAEILSVKALAGASDYFSYIWTCGFDLNTTSGEMYYTGNHEADLITNSWGWITPPSSQFDYLSLTWDILSTPGFLDAGYPGVLHVFSAGNEGSGYMTTGPPACSPGVLAVGASTTSHWLDYLYGPDQMDYEGIASFSSKGPSFSGYVKPDIVAPGLGGYAGMPLYGAFFNDMWLPSIWEAPGTVWYNYTMFAGTSQAAPVAAGVAALVYDALLPAGVVNPAQVKNILQYTAVDLGYDPATQGFGRVDAEAACEFVENGVGMVGASTDSWNYFANFIGDAWAYWGVLPTSWTGLDVNQTIVDYPLDNYEGSLFFGQVMAGDVVTNRLSLYDDDTDMYGTPMVWGGGSSGVANYMVEAETYTFTSWTFSYNDTVVVDEQMYGYFVLSDEIGGTYDTSEGLYSYMTVGVSFDAGDVAGDEPWMFLYDWEDLNADGMPNLWNASTGVGSELSRITSASDASNTNMMPFGVALPDAVGTNLDGDLVIVIHDPIHDVNQTAWGNNFTCTVIFWTTAVASELAFGAGTTNTINVTLTAPGEVGIHLGYATVIVDGQTAKIPYSYTVVANLTATEGEVNGIVNGYGTELEPYDNAMYGCMNPDRYDDDWDYRTLVVHSDWGAGYLGIRVLWADTGNDMYVSVLSSEGLELASGHGMTSNTTAVIAAVAGDGDYYLFLHPIALNGTLGLPVEYDVQVMWYSELGTEDVVVSYNADNLANPIVMANGADVVEDTATGDHVVINASYPAFELVHMPEYEVTGITISFLAGVYYHETQNLVIPSDTYDPFSGPIQLDQFDWMFVDGIKAGDNVDIEVDFTNGDCDVMVWWTEIDNSTWTYGNNIVGDVMATGAHPETASFTADRAGEIAVGCFDYDLSAGTWTLTVDTRVGLDIPAVGPEVTYDTYQFLKNGSFQVLVAAVTETNIDFDVNYPSFTFNNFFTPEMLTVTVAGTGATKTISWTSSDLNAGDEHFYEVLISADSGTSYQLLGMNITTLSFSWDSTSFLTRDTYRAMVRVYDNDPIQSNDSAATGVFWMGLSDSLESSIFSAGTLTPPTTTEPEPTTTSDEPVPTITIEPLWIGLIAGIGAGVVVVLILFLVKKR